MGGAFRPCACASVEQNMAPKMHVRQPILLIHPCDFVSRLRPCDGLLPALALAVLWHRTGSSTLLCLCFALHSVSRADDSAVHARSRRTSSHQYCSNAY